MKTTIIKTDGNQDIVIEVDVQESKNIYLDDELEDLRNRRVLLKSKIEDIETNRSSYISKLDKNLLLISLGCGVTSGIYDILFEKTLSLEDAKLWGKEKTDKFIVKVSQSQGYKGNDIVGAIRYMENNYPSVSDKAENEFGGARQHHLRDFSHHPTLCGAVFSVLTQFTHKAYGTNTAGEFIVVDIDNKYFINESSFVDNIFHGIVSWFFHLVSDMGGSSYARQQGKDGAGIPGPLLSIIKEVSSCKIFNKYNDDNNKDLSVEIAKFYNGTKIKRVDEKGNIKYISFDLREEIGLLKELTDESLPILVTNAVVRACYFCLSLTEEIKNNNIESVEDLKQIDITKVLPFNNATVRRMLLVTNLASRTIDIADAITKSLKGGKFDSEELLANINIAGVGDLLLLIGSNSRDKYKSIQMGKEISQLKNEELNVQNKIIYKSLEKECNLLQEKFQLQLELEQYICRGIEEYIAIYIQTNELNESIENKMLELDDKLKKEIIKKID